MRISGVKKIPALYGAASLILITGLLATGCAGTAVTQTAPQEQQATEAQTTASDEIQLKDSDPVMKFNDEVVDYGTLKRWWAYATDQNHPDDFEKLSDSDKLTVYMTLLVNHMAAKEARACGLVTDNFFRAREYELYTRYMPAIYAENVIGVEVNPTDAELLMSAPMALPEVVVRVFVAREPEAAKKVYERAMAGEDIEKIIRAESQGLSAENGGLTKWMTVQNADKFPAPVVQRFLDAKVGDILEPFYQDIGFLVVRIEGKHTPEEVQQIWLDQNRETVVTNLRKEAYRKRVAELVKKRTDIEFDSNKVDDVISGKLPKDETLVKIRGIEFNLDSLTPDLMKMNSKHGGNEYSNHVSKFIERAAVTEEAYSLGFKSTPVADEKVRVKGEKFLAQLLKSSIGQKAADLPISDEDVKKYYEDNPGEFTEPARWCLSLVECETKEQADAALAAMREGKTFADTAKEFSLGQARDSGGAIGCYDQKGIPEPVFEQIESLNTGSCTQEPFVVNLSDGKQRWLLAQVDAVLNPAVVSYDRVKRPIVEERIKTGRRAKALSELVGSLAKKYGYENCFQKDGKEKVSQ